MAATLIHIKSRMLLPRPEPDADEGPGEDPRDALVRRLLEHQQFKSAAELLHERETWRAAQWLRPDDRIAAIAGDEYEPELEVDLFSLLAAFRGVVERAKHRPMVLLPPEEISVESRIEQLVGRLSETEACGFEDSVLRCQIARRSHRDVPRAAGDDPPQDDPHLPERRVRAHPRVQARTARRCPVCERRRSGEQPWLISTRHTTRPRRRAGSPLPSRKPAARRPERTAPRPCQDDGRGGHGRGGDGRRRAGRRARRPDARRAEGDHRGARLRLAGTDDAEGALQAARQRAVRGRQGRPRCAAAGLRAARRAADRAGGRRLPES